MLFNIQVAKSNDLIQFDDTKLPVASRNFALEYGLRQWIADGHAQVKRQDFAAGDTGETAFVAKVRERTKARETALRTGQGLPGTTAVDPIRVMQAQLGLSDEDMMSALRAAAAAKKRAA